MLTSCKQCVFFIVEMTLAVICREKSYAIIINIFFMHLNALFITVYPKRYYIVKQKGVVICGNCYI